MKTLLAWFLLLWTATSFAVQPVSPTTTAQLLAGVFPTTTTSTVETTAWRQHRSSMGEQWILLQRRLQAIKDWRRENIGQERTPCKTLLYPFSGPDFLNAYAFFPSCNVYILFGLESPGQAPNLETMTEQQTIQYLTDMRASLSDLLHRNYFITNHMATQLNTPSLQGVTPLLMATMGGLHLQIKNIELVSIHTAKGVKITFNSGGVFQKDQIMYYFSQDASNGPLSKNPQFVSFISADKQSYTLIKSASYLLHHPEFSTMKTNLLDTTVLLIQDDTGIPYKHLHNWQVIPHGKYLGTIEIFSNRFQADLDTLYQVTPNVPPLAFSFGYLWRNEQSGLIIARKR